MDDAALARLVEAAFDFVCTRKLRELIDPAQILDGIDAVGTDTRLRRLIARLGAPARARLIERAKKSGLLVGAWLPAPVKDALAAMLGQPAPIPRKLVDSVVKDERLRDNARAMLQETLSNVIHKAFSVTPGGKGLRGMMRAAGGLFGGLGDEIQRQLEERVREFVDSGVAQMQNRVAQKLTSEETARLLGKRRRRVFLDAMERKESEVARFIDRAPHAIIEAMIPSIVTHNLQRAELREALRVEIAAAVEELSQQTIGELLDELGLRALVKDSLLKSPLYKEFLASAEFQKWLSRG